MAGLSDAEKSIQEINRKIQELSRTLGKSFTVFDVNELQQAQTYLNGLRAELRDMGGDLDYIAQSFRNSVDELSRQNSYLSISRQSLRKLSDISRTLLEYRKGETDLSKEQLKNLQQQAKKRIEDLKAAEKYGRLTAAQRDEIKEAIKEEQNLEKAFNQIYQIQKKINKETGAFQSAMEGISEFAGKIGFSGIASSLTETIKQTKEAKLQFELNRVAIKENGKELDELYAKGDTLTDLERQRKFELENINDSLSEQNNELSTQMKFSKNFLGNLKSQLSVANLIKLAIVELFAALQNVDQSAGSYAKNMNVTYEEALKVRQEMANLGALSMDASLNSQALQETLSFVGQQLGTNAKLNEQDLKTFTKLREQAGLTNEELYGIQELSFQNGKSLEQNSKEILGGAKAYASRNKLALNEKQILKDVSKASAALKLSLGSVPGALSEAAAKARQFGLSLEQTEKISQSLLNFESSIENELSAELLTGKELNLERARLLALSGDTAEAAAEIAKQVGTAAEFGKMNVLQQDALAKAAGMEREELAKSLIEREALAKIGFKDAAAAKAKYNELRKTMSAQEAAKALGDAELARQYEQQSVQERFNEAVIKLKDLFIQIAEPVLNILNPLMEIVQTVLPLINALLQPIMYTFQAISGVITGNFEGLSNTQVVLGGIVATLTGAYAVFKGIAAIQTIINGLTMKDLLLKGQVLAAKSAEFVASKAGAAVNIISGAWASLGPIPFVGAALAAAAIAAGIAYLSSSSKKGNDIFSPGEGSSGYGKRTLLGPEGAIQLNNKDTVIAGTNLFGDDVTSEPGKPTQMAGAGEIKIKSEEKPQGGNADMTTTNNLLRELISTINQAGVVTLDGQKVGEALKVGTYKIQ